MCVCMSHIFCGAFTTQYLAGEEQTIYIAVHLHDT